MVCELGTDLTDTRGQIGAVGGVYPSVEATAEYRDCDVCEELGTGSVGTSLAQYRREGVGNGSELRAPTLLQLGTAGNDLSSLRGVWRHASAQRRCDRGERGQYRLERGELWVDLPERVGKQFRQLIGAGKKHVALVGEVAGERAPGQAGAVGDLSDGDVLVPQLQIQLDRRCPQALLCLRVPPGHR